MDFKEELKAYWQTHKRILMSYIALNIILYLTNFFFYRKNIDAPVDLIFATVFIMIFPGIVILITLYKKEGYHSDKDFFLTLLIHILAPILIGICFMLLYETVRMYHTNVFILIALHGLSLPGILLALIVLFEIKLGFPRILLKAFVLIGVISSYFVIFQLIKYETYWIFDRPINIMYFIVFPLVLILFPYRKSIISR